MSHAYANPYVVAAAAPSVRAEFIRRTYAHLALAILAFAGLEAFLLQTDWAVALAGKMMGNRMGWLLVLGAWMFVSWLAQSWAHSATSRGAQYAGLALFVAGEAILFLPLLLLASRLAPDGAIIKKAAAFTGVLFVALTAGAFLTRKDFSFLGGFLRIGGFVAMGIIVLSLVFNFGFGFGTLFAGAMILFAAIAVLYDTSNVIHHYRTDQYVAASLGLFASVALMFWYILRLVMSMNRD